MMGATELPSAVMKMMRAPAPIPGTEEREVDAPEGLRARCPERYGRADQVAVKFPA